MFVCAMDPGTTTGSAQGGSELILKDGEVVKVLLRDYTVPEAIRFLASLRERKDHVVLLTEKWDQTGVRTSPDPTDIIGAMRALHVERVAAGLPSTFQRINRGVKRFVPPSVRRSVMPLKDPTSRHQSDALAIYRWWVASQRRRIIAAELSGGQT